MAKSPLFTSNPRSFITPTFVSLYSKFFVHKVESFPLSLRVLLQLFLHDLINTSSGPIVDRV